MIVKVKINFQIIHERPWALILNSLRFIGDGALRPQRRQEDETEAVSISNFVRLQHGADIIMSNVSAIFPRKKITGILKFKKINQHKQDFILF